MPAERVKCSDCDRMILPETAKRHGGLCPHCARVPPSVREETRAFERRWASGLLFTPSAEERASARRPVELENATTEWTRGDGDERAAPRDVPSVLSLTAREGAGHVHLHANTGALLALSFNAVYGVCDYTNDETGDRLYAYTKENLSQQVSADRQLEQVCPCCGVGMLWYPSRFHMPRERAFEIVSAVVLRDAKRPAEVLWLDPGDFSHTAPGKG